MNVVIWGVIKTPHPLNIMPNTHKLLGTTIDNNGNPVQRKVLLLREMGVAKGNLEPPEYEMVRAKKSSLSGAWDFEHLYEGHYTVIAYDHTGQFDPVIKGGLLTEPMEA